MNTHLLQLLAGTGLISMVGVAQAGELMRLSESQLDQVNAGNDLMMTIDGVQASIEKNGTVTVKGVPIKDFKNLVVYDGNNKLTVAQGKDLRVLTIDRAPTEDITNSVLEYGSIKLSMGWAENVWFGPK